MHLLLVEDDDVVAVLTSEILRIHGYRVSRVADGESMQQFLRGDDFPDLILLDLTLPDEDGIVLTRQIRATSDVPIIVVSAREELSDRMAALESGADDYITKPFAPEELAVRIKNLLARSGRNGKNSVIQQPQQIDLGEIRIEPDARLVRNSNGDPIHFTTSEFDLLMAFVSAPGRILNRDFLLDAINRGNEPPSTRVIDVLIGRIRKKIERDSKTPKLIQTVPNLGYRLNSN